MTSLIQVAGFPSFLISSALYQTCIISVQTLVGLSKLMMLINDNTYNNNSTNNNNDKLLNFLEFYYYVRPWEEADETLTDVESQLVFSMLSLVCVSR